MFKFEEICELIRLVASSPIASVEIERADTRLRIEGGALPTTPRPAPAGPVAADEPDLLGALETAPRAADGDEDDSLLHRVTSPIVGTFYRSPNPDAEPYVTVGDRVAVGQVLCIVEAMKLMNEIECDRAGTVTRIVPDNAQPVEFGSVLFLVRPD